MEQEKGKNKNRFIDKGECRVGGAKGKQGSGGIRMQARDQPGRGPMVELTEPDGQGESRGVRRGPMVELTEPDGQGESEE